MNGLLVKDWMQKKKMRPEQLAVKLDVSFATVKKIMAGQKVHKHTIVVLANLMETTAEELLVIPKKQSKTH